MASVVSHQRPLGCSPKHLGRLHSFECPPNAVSPSFGKPANNRLKPTARGALRRTRGAAWPGVRQKGFHLKGRQSVTLRTSGRKVIERYPQLPACWAPYDIRFPLIAAQVTSLVRDRMPNVTVEHIGSTAVPGCGGKGVIDVMVVCAPECLERVKDLLGDLGFQPQVTRDAFPESRPMRVGALRYQGRLFRIHAHVLTTGAHEAGGLLAFRDRLRTDSALRASYEACKQTILATGAVDSVAYAEAKARFFQGVEAGR